MTTQPANRHAAGKILGSVASIGGGHPGVIESIIERQHIFAAGARPSFEIPVKVAISLWLVSDSSGENISVFPPPVDKSHLSQVALAHLAHTRVLIWCLRGRGPAVCTRQSAREIVAFDRVPASHSSPAVDRSSRLRVLTGPLRLLSASVTMSAYLLHLY